MSLKDIANMLILGVGGLTEEKILASWEYRKGKSLADIKKARQYGFDNGSNKVEYEIEWTEMKLKQVLKRKK